MNEFTVHVEITKMAPMTKGKKFEEKDVRESRSRKRKRIKSEAVNNKKQKILENKPAKSEQKEKQQKSLKIENFRMEGNENQRIQIEKEENRN